jgi:hypothetical protein
VGTYGYLVVPVEFFQDTFHQIVPIVSFTPLAGGYFHYLMPITAAIVVLRTVLDIINGVF